MKIRFIKNPKKNKVTTYETNIFQCPYCEQIITLVKQINHNYVIPCPLCGHSGLVSIKPDAARKKLEDTKQERSKAHWYNQPWLRAKILGLILISIGFVLLFDPSEQHLKMSIALFFIGSLLYLLISEEKIMLPDQVITTNSFLEKNKLVISEKIVILIIASTLLLFLITRPGNIEIFLVLLYLSLLIIKELIDEFTPSHVKKRLNIFIIIFFVIFLIIIAERIITIIGI